MLVGILIGVVLWLLIGVGQIAKKKKHEYIRVDQALFHLFFLVLLFGTIGLIIEMSIDLLKHWLV